MSMPTAQNCRWCGQPFVGSDMLGKPCDDCRERHKLRISGIVRDAENETSIVIRFDRKPTDGELSAIHHYVRTMAEIIDLPPIYELTKQ